MDETQNLLEQARDGDPDAFKELFERHRGRLLKIIALRMDRRIAGRVDPSDIIQETYMEAFKRLPKYLKKPDMEFYDLLRWIAREKTIECYRRHVGTQKRTIRNEVPLTPVDSSAKLVSGLIGRLPTPSQALARVELAELLQEALSQLDSDEQDLILWHHFEQLSAREMAELLNITEAAASKRYIRAVKRLQKILQDLGVSKLRT